MTTIHFKCVRFDELSLEELYQLLALRQEVFIVEQHCIFQDIDGIDQKSWHLLGFDDTQKLLAYTRLIPAGISYDGFTSIGRVVTSPKARGLGLGKVLMQKSIQENLQLFDNQAIKIGAQKHLEQFYNSLGFKSTDEDYMEDGILHTKMIYPSLR